jgi:hypothetical protein
VPSSFFATASLVNKRVVPLTTVCSAVKAKSRRHKTKH